MQLGTNRRHDRGVDVAAAGLHYGFRRTALGARRAGIAVEEEGARFKMRRGARCRGKRLIGRYQGKHDAALASAPAGVSAPLTPQRL